MDSEEGFQLESPLLTEAKLNGDDSISDDLLNNTSDQITSVVLFSTFVATCGSCSYGCAIAYSSAAQLGLMEDLGLTLPQYSIFGSTLTLGGAIGALFSGKAASFMGRKHTMGLSQILSFIGWLSIIFAKSIWLLYIGRLMIGIGVGLLSYVIPVYIAEIATKHTRGAYIASTQLMQNIGYSLTFILGNFTHWRVLAIISMVPCLIHLFSILFIQESPRWLAQVGREKECENALQSLRGDNANISKEIADIKEILEATQDGQNARISDLFQRRYAYSLIVGIGLLVLQQLTGLSGVNYYTASIFRKAGFSTSIGTTTMAFILIPKSLLGIILVHRCGRRPLLMSSAFGMCLSCVLLGFAFSLQELHLFKQFTPIFAFIGVLGFIAMFALGMGGLPWVIMSEIFPINVKDVAGSLGTLANWSTSWVITYTFNFMLHWNPSAMFFIFSGICGGTVVFIWMLVPETMGQTLEQIQTSILSL